MQYLGIEVHAKASVWCLLDADGEIRAPGKLETTVPALGELVAEFSKQEELWVGQEVGTMAYLVHDAIAGAGAEILSFNAHQLRMIAASRKKTDRRDAYWIARALQSGLIAIMEGKGSCVFANIHPSPPIFVARSLATRRDPSAGNREHTLVESLSDRILLRHSQQRTPK